METFKYFALIVITIALLVVSWYALIVVALIVFAFLGAKGITTVSKAWKGTYINEKS